MATTIVTKNSSVALSAPSAGQLVQGEMAINVTDKKIYTLDGGGNVVLLAAGGSPYVTPQVIQVTDNTFPALRITQLGTAAALLVEDSSNPDASPFVIDATGNVYSGYLTPFDYLSIGGGTLNPRISVAGTTGDLGSIGAAVFANATTAPTVVGAKSRNTTVGSHTVVQSGDSLLNILAEGSDGTAFIRAASIVAAVDGTPGTNDMPGRLVFSTTADGASTVTERMRIDSSGNVGIGSTPLSTARLYVTNTVTDTANSESGIYSILTANNASGSNIKIGNRSSVTTGASFAGTNLLNAFRGDITYSLASAYTGSLQGFRTSIGNSGAGAVSAIYGFTSTAPSNTGGGSITNFYGFAQDDVTTATAVYGYLGSVTSGTGKYNLYMSGTADNYFAGNVGVGTTTPTSLLQTTGSSSKSAFKTPNIAEVNTVSATAATGTINYDVTTQSVLYYTTNASGNFTVNFRGSSGTTLNTVMQTGESISVTFLVTNGSTAYYNSAVQVDGSSVTPKWQGGTAPTSGNASSIDSYTYVIIKTGSAAFTVLASQTKFA